MNYKKTNKIKLMEILRTVDKTLRFAKIFLAEDKTWIEAYVIIGLYLQH